MASAYGSIPRPNSSHAGKGYGDPTGGVTDFARGNPVEASPLARSLGQQSHLHDQVDDSVQGSSITGEDAGVKRSVSTGSTAVYNSAPSRSGTLKKKGSVKRMGSLKRSSSRRSLKAGSIKGLIFSDEEHDVNSVFHTPIPTTGSPTEILADRFQTWRQLLKSLIAYFREVQGSYETRSKALIKLQNTAANIANPSIFSHNNSLGEATRILDDYHKHSIAEANKSRDIEGDVIGALTGLRSDLAQKIKEIKSLNGDFKNSVEKEVDSTRREIEKLRLAIEEAQGEGSGAMGKNDPFVVRLGVDRAIERQIDEENYLHRAYLNLESSGRELESIVVGEIQKAYKALAGILRREGDDAYSVVEDLRSGPITMPKDQEWSHFVSHDPHFVSPETSLRRIEDITYPGKDHPAAAEIRAGMLERKSKYLKSYTAGWYVLSPTHLHEFKSADKIYTQPPVMSLYLGDQRLGSHSEAGSSSHKFMLKGKQTGGHKGHNWVFRAESHDTLMAWFNDIKTLTEGTAPERHAFVQRHTRSLSNSSDRPKSMSSDGFADDDADAVPFAADAASLSEQYPAEPRPQRPMPGGRFPSDLQVPRLAAPVSPESDEAADDYARYQSELSPVDAYQQTKANPYKLAGVSDGSRTFSSAGVSTINEPVAVVPDQQLDGQNEEQAAQPIARSQADSMAFMLPPVATPPIDAAKDERQKVLLDEPSSASAVPSVGSVAAAPPVDPAIVPVLESVPHSSLVAPRTVSTEAVKAAPLTSEAVEESTTVDPVLGATGVRRMSLVAPRTASTEAVLGAPLVSGTKLGANTLEVKDAPAVQTSAAKVEDAPISGPAPTVAPPVTRQQSSGLGGLEREGAHLTGALFPKVVRHDTDMSISRLHVPGEFPKRS